MVVCITLIMGGKARINVNFTLINLDFKVSINSEEVLSSRASSQFSARFRAGNREERTQGVTVSI